MINPHHELFRWGPIPGKPIYTSFFMEAIEKAFPIHYKYHWPEIFFYFINDDMTFICDYHELREFGKKNFFSWVMDDRELEKVKKAYLQAVKNIHQTYSKIKNLEKVTGPQLRQLYLNFHKNYLLFWLHGLVPEVSNWGGEQILKEKLAGMSLTSEQFIAALEKLSAPERLSFYQEEELDLLEVKYKEGTNTFKNALQKHRQKYFWLANSYYETDILNENYFQKKLKDMNVKNIPEEIKKIKEIPFNAKRAKRKVITELKINKEIQKIAQRLSYCIWWQDTRKKQIFIANHYITIILAEMSRRKNIPLDALQRAWCTELEQFITGKKIPLEILQQRKKKFLGHYATTLTLVSDEKKFDLLVNPFLEKKIDKTITKIKGTVASIGKELVRGKVKILLSPKESEKVQRGDILVAPFTSPEYIIAMRKAAAIITDEGGMTSHAAIVSRELGIPCIVGTNTATRVLKDNEMVEVDGRKGIVRKIKN